MPFPSHCSLLTVHRSTVEQGTILDRIDYNIEQVVTTTKSGAEELTKANEYSKKARTMKCIFFLIFIIRRYNLPSSFTPFLVYATRTIKCIFFSSLSFVGTAVLCNETTLSSRHFSCMFR
jgi:hypothetical protein